MGDYGRESTRAENAVVFYIQVLLQVNDENDVDEIRELMAEALSEKAGRKVELAVPLRGEKSAPGVADPLTV